jgi:hypothetical protein
MKLALKLILGVLFGIFGGISINVFIIVERYSDENFHWDDKSHAIVKTPEKEYVVNNEHYLAVDPDTDCTEQGTYYEEPQEIRDIINDKWHFHFCIYVSFILALSFIVLRFFYLTISNIPIYPKKYNIPVFLIIRIFWEIQLIAVLAGVTMLLAGIHTKDCLQTDTHENQLKSSRIWSITIGVINTTLFLICFILQLVKKDKSLYKPDSIMLKIFLISYLLIFLTVITGTIPALYLFFTNLAQTNNTVGYITLPYIVSLIAEQVYVIRLHYQTRINEIPVRSQSSSDNS